MSDPVLRPLRVFLCHSSGDKPTVRELYRKLSAESWLDVWLDEEKLLPGQDWEYEIEKALDDTDAVVVILSTGSVSKEGYVQKELRFALDIALEKPEGTIFVLPIRLDDCERPRKLRNIHGVDYFPDERREWAYARVRRSLELRANALLIPPVKSEPTQPQKETTVEATPISEKSSLEFQHDLMERPSISDNSAWIEERKREEEKTTPEQHESVLLRAENRENVVPVEATSSIAQEPDQVVWGGIEFCRVPAGPFLMGTPTAEKDAVDREKPQHTVDIPYDYYIARFLVTNEQYAAYAKAGRITHPVKNWEKSLDHPVWKVRAWDEAMAYCHWLNKLLKGKLPPEYVLRLPTEAEWEKAARGPDGRIFPWGNEFDKNRCNTYEGRKGQPTPVGYYSPQGDSPYGCTDMAGNVSEWTHSLMTVYPYKPDDGRENEGDTTVKIRRAVRSGSFSHNYQGARVAYRSRILPFYLQGGIGFRVVVAPSLPKSKRHPKSTEFLTSGW